LAARLRAALVVVAVGGVSAFLIAPLRPFEPVETQSDALASARQVVQSMRVEDRAISDWSMDASRFDSTGLVSEPPGRMVRNCLGGFLPSGTPDLMCFPDPVWRFHFTAPPQNGLVVEASVAIDARTRNVVAECDSVYLLNQPRFDTNSCGLSNPVGG
jgi:hypothetical protein